MLHALPLGHLTRFSTFLVVQHEGLYRIINAEILLLGHRHTYRCLSFLTIQTDNHRRLFYPPLKLVPDSFLSHDHNNLDLGSASHITYQIERKLPERERRKQAQRLL